MAVSGGGIAVSGAPPVSPRLNTMTTIRRPGAPSGKALYVLTISPSLCTIETTNEGGPPPPERSTEKAAAMVFPSCVVHGLSGFPGISVFDKDPTGVFRAIVSIPDDSDKTKLGVNALASFRSAHGTPMNLAKGSNAA